MTNPGDRLTALRDALEERILVLDGAMGTSIQDLGLGESDFRGDRFVDHATDLAGNNDLLNLTRPDAVRSIHPEGTFVEVFVDTPLSVCEARDVKGLYAKARAGEIPDFTGISAPYEAPERPELVLDTNRQTVEESVGRLIGYLEEKGYLSAP